VLVAVNENSRTWGEHWEGWRLSGSCKHLLPIVVSILERFCGTGVVVRWTTPLVGITMCVRAGWRVKPSCNFVVSV
jgi:hypothetical protein